MKKFFKFATLLFVAVATTFTACKEPVEPTPVDPFKDASLEIKLVGADVDNATIAVNGQVLKVVSYVVEPTAAKKSYTAAEIFSKGEQNGTLVVLESEGVTPIKFTNLEPETEYTVQVAGRISADKVWDQVKEFKFTTAAEPIIPVLRAEFISAESTTAQLNVYTENISRIAYTVAKASEATTVPSLQVVFATGKNVNTVTGDNALTISSLSPNTEYVVYIAGEIAGIEEYMEEIVTVTGIKTSDFAEAIAVRDINYRGFTVDVRVDPKVKESNHVIKWATSDLYMYNRNGGQASMDAPLMNLHDTAWGGINLFNESRSLIIDEAHSYIYDSQGQIENWYFESIVPGQPQVVVLGEFRYGESEWGWGYGYYTPMFDYGEYTKAVNSAKEGEIVDEAPYWTGFYQNLQVRVQEPDKLPDDMLDVDITTYPDDAVVRISADESIDLVAVMILSELEYNTAIKGLGNNEEYLQWFATSLMGMYEGASMTLNPYDASMGLNGSFQTAISEFLLDVPRESKFWVYVVGMAGDFNNDGYLDCNQQVCKSFEFYLPKPTKPAPEIEVTALESTSPFKVAFNVKCPTKDAVKAKLIANYEKEWLMTGMTAQEIVYAYGVELGGLDVDKINSNEGLTIELDSRPNERTYLAAMVANDEGTETYSEAAIATSLPDTDYDRVESELFESLLGDWTATATVMYKVYNEETEEYDTVNEVTTSAITIGEVGYPEVLPEEVYDTYQKHGVSREDTDVYYAELTEAIDLFNEQTRMQNRILMNGFDFAAGQQPYFEYKSPYELFISDTYNGYTSTMPVYDFGPKWYLEVAADGTVTAPFNVNYFTPMTSWYHANQAIYEGHMIAYDYVNGVPVGYVGDADGNIVNGHFPVEVSEDGNTIIVKPLVYGTTSYYPNVAIYYGNGQYNLSVAVISDIVITRNTTAAAPAAKAARKAGKVGENVVTSSQKIQTPIRPSKRGNFTQKKEYQKVEGNTNLTKEQRAEKWFDNRRTAGRR